MGMISDGVISEQNYRIIAQTPLGGEILAVLVKLSDKLTAAKEDIKDLRTEVKNLKQQLDIIQPAEKDNTRTSHRLDHYGWKR
jgi:Skp family chaperone for outer membrane proteins